LAVGVKRSSRLYLTSVLIYGLAALLIALPTSAVFAFYMSRWFLNLFNIDYNVFQVSRLALIVQVLSAVLVPLLAVLWPVLKGTAITVREALSTYGLGGDFKHSFIDRIVEKFGTLFCQHYMPPPWAISFRRKGRLILTLLALTTAGVMFLVVMSLIASTNLTLDNEMKRQGYDVRIGFTSDQH
jgi:putative ABC transport system permease protein